MRKRGVWQSVFLLGILLLALTCCGRVGDSDMGSLPGSDSRLTGGESHGDEGISVSGETYSSEGISDSGEMQGGDGAPDSGITDGSEEVFPAGIGNRRLLWRLPV